ncbi:uncharacterized protein [Chelonus insularis]|uniref:uncharacterized protein isoform X1 n=1 Tax=Chelonus insularis TaxID=460826 RepID=UPI00158C730F|nr:uncharacterized protein LOC118069590 isoform X1 [Chelonus insularis]
MTVSIIEKLRFMKLFNQTLNQNEIQGVLFILNLHPAETRRVIEHITNKFPIAKNCTMIIMSHSYQRCVEVEQMFRSLKILYIFNAYYICLLNNEPVIFTHNVYGESPPSLWKIVDHKLLGGNWWTLYRRNFRKGNICQGFLFDRFNMKNNAKSANIILGLTIRDKSTFQKSQYRDTYSEHIIKKKDSKKTHLYYEDISAATKLLNMNVKYYHSIDNPVYFYRNTSVDVIFATCFISHLRPFWLPFHPVSHEEFVMLSHNRGLCTPLEKIADFYGLYTIISLIVVLINTFFVIWYKMNKNVSLAAFDLLRLLINDGVLVPINTFPLRIFFSMIFLYFLVIHSTFSGHLAEFLTKSKLRKNIDSVENALFDSRIKQIYNFGFHYSDSNNQGIFNRKSIRTFSIVDCIRNVENDPSSVCIGFASNFQLFLTRQGKKDDNVSDENLSLENKNIDKYYIGNKHLGSMPMSLLYRPRFPFTEKFNFILMYLVETRIIGITKNKRRSKKILALHKRMIFFQSNFRKINLNDLQFAFIILIIGINLGLLSFLLELFINYYYQYCCKIKNRCVTRITIKDCTKKMYRKRKFTKITMSVK